MPTAAASLSHLLRDAMRRHSAAGRTAFLGDSGPTSYADLVQRIDGYAAAVSGLTPGAPVGILTSRSVEGVSLFFGLMQAGASPCFMPPALTADALRGRMRAVGMRRIVLDDGADARAAGLHHAETEVWRIGELTPSGPGSTTGHAPSTALTTASRAMLLFTSGSTSTPKAVPLTHANLLCHVDGVIAHTGITPADRLLHVMPLHHTNGVHNQLIAPLVAGASVVLAARFQPDRIEAQLGEFGVTYMTGVPTMYSRVLPHLNDQAARRTLRFLRCGSAPITLRLHREIEAVFGVPLVVSYGLSEATCTSTMNPPQERRLGTVGTVLRGQAIRLCTPGTLDAVPTGDEGEVCIGGGCVMTGYVGETAGEALRDGWLRTGDLGQLDEDGYLAITGRLKDVINRGGENLSPRVVEDAVLQHPAVQACCVVAGPHHDLGEVPVAFVVWRNDEAVSIEELQRFVAEILPRRYRPDIRIIAALPETPVGKVDRQALRQSLTVDSQD
jgi:acyl-CoA synthetase (AMP-forming)/AMP-acid ligase II